MSRLTRMAMAFCFVSVLVGSLSWSKIDPETAVGVWLLDEGQGTIPKTHPVEDTMDRLTVPNGKMANLAKDWNSMAVSGSKSNRHQNFKLVTN